MLSISYCFSPLCIRDWQQRHLSSEKGAQYWRWKIHGRKALWVEMIWNWRINFMDNNLFPMRSGVSEWASEHMNERSGARERSELCAASKWVSGASERANRSECPSSLRVHFSHSTHCGKRKRRKKRRKKETKEAKKTKKKRQRKREENIYIRLTTSDLRKKVCFFIFQSQGCVHADPLWSKTTLSDPDRHTILSTAHCAWNRRIHFIDKCYFSWVDQMT